MFSRREQPGGQRKISGGRARQVSTEAKHSTHEHDDKGRTKVNGDRLETYCTCGAFVSSDFITKED